jgi:hypothetical protein
VVRRQPKGAPRGAGGQFASSPHDEADIDLSTEVGLDQVLESAARFQELVPDAVLVGGSAAAYWARHRDSLDHDHVLRDLSERFDAVLDAIEATEGWVTNRVSPGKIILGELGGIETGIRQLIRSRPLEVVKVELPSGRKLCVPTIEEILRVKAYLIVRRNRVRDYLDVAALSDRLGTRSAAATLAKMDDYYDAGQTGTEPVSTQVARQLADPRPVDTRVISQLKFYKNLAPRWQDWEEVRSVCRSVAVGMLWEDGPQCSSSGT